MKKKQQTKATTKRMEVATQLSSAQNNLEREMYGTAKFNMEGGNSQANYLFIHSFRALPDPAA